MLLEPRNCRPYHVAFMPRLRHRPSRFSTNPIAQRIKSCLEPQSEFVVHFLNIEALLNISHAERLTRALRMWSWFLWLFGWAYLCGYLCWHSTGAGWAGITNWVDHVSDGGSPGSTVLCELTRDFHPVLSPSGVAEDLLFGEGFQVCLDRGCPHLQQAPSSPAPRARRCGQK